MDLSIIIVNYNTTEHLKECLNSLMSFSSNTSLEVIVVDNNSPDRDIEKFPGLFQNVSFYLRDRNDGFGAGCNFGAYKAKGKILAFVNPDIVFESDIFTKVITLMNEQKSIGACSPLLKDFNNKVVYNYNNFPNLKWEFNEAMGIGNDRRMTELINVPQIYNRQNFKVDWVTGACLFIKSEIFKKVKGYDEKFFLYYEDTDLQLKVHKVGYEIWLLSELAVKHFTNSSVVGEIGNNIYFFHIHRSKLLYFYKNSNFLKRNLVRTINIVGILLRISLLPFMKKFRNMINYKLNQYKRILGIYLKNYGSLQNSSYKN